MRRRGAPLRYVPAASIGGEKHIVVDGAPRQGTVLTLSHWPGTPTPPEVWADLSAEIVLKALARPRVLPRGVSAVTVDHYDADGAISLGLLVVEGLAEAHGALLAAAARAGDFDVVTSRDAALVAFALGALRSGPGPTAEPPDEACRPDHLPDATAAAAERAVAALPGLAARPRDFEELWGPEAAAYDASCRMLADGALSVEERPALDLAVVRVDRSHPEAAAAAWEGAPVHPAAVHSATTCLRIATVAGRRCAVRFRYETWVRLARTGRPRPRVDLTRLAAMLGDLERDGGTWVFDGAGAITPALHRTDEGETTLAPERFLAELAAALEVLDQGPPAWDPYARPVTASPGT